MTTGSSWFSIFAEANLILISAFCRISGGIESSEFDGVLNNANVELSDTVLVSDVSLGDQPKWTGLSNDLVAEYPRRLYCRSNGYIIVDNDRLTVISPNESTIIRRAE